MMGGDDEDGKDKYGREEQDEEKEMEKDDKAEVVESS